MAVEYNDDENTSFPAKEYLKRYIDPRADPQGVHEEYLKAYHSFYSKYSQYLNKETSQVMEFGGGPTVYSMISAVPHVKEFTFTEYALSNRTEVEKWRNEEKDCHNWNPYVKYVVEDLESNPNPLATREREKMVRSKLREIKSCDVRSNDLVDPTIQIKSFDVIQTNLCLEAVCQSLEEYVSKVHRLSQMLNPGGYILCIGAKDCSWYTCAGSGHKFYVLKMSQKELEDCYVNAGLVLKESFTLDTKNHSISATKSFHFIAAQKVTADTA